MENNTHIKFKRHILLLCLMPVLVLTGFTGRMESEREQKIYSYVQVPKEYCDDERWTGDWVEIESGGQKFFYFGCGICCFSNVCSTFYGIPLKPDTMFAWARKYGDYHPESGRGALSWKQLKRMYEHFGCETKTMHKPGNYADFQKDVNDADTTMVLVCKYDDDKLWFYTLGHYVNLWEYDPEDDTVFVTDSSGMFNRQRVKLEDIYRALKTASDAQYMCINKTDDFYSPYMVE